MEELYAYFIGAVAVVAAMMSGIKRFPFVKKEWYNIIAVVITVVVVAVMTLMLGWNFPIFIGGLLSVFIAEYGLDKKAFTPILSWLLGRT